MKSKWFCNRGGLVRAINRAKLRSTLVAGILVFSVRPTRAEAPLWMHSLVNAPLPAHDEKTNAVLLYEEHNVNVISTDKIKTTVRRAYKILRPDGRDFG